jgi:hypothetical protein
MRRILVTSASGANGDGSSRKEGLDAGGGAFAPDGRYCVTLRRRGTILALPARLDTEGEPLLPDGAVPFPRGFGFGNGGQLYLCSGIGPSGEGDNTITTFDRDGRLRNPRLVSDPELSPLDPAIAPGGNLVVSSEWPFGSPSARTTIREYDPSTGRLVRVLAPDPAVKFTRPRGLRFGPGGELYCVGQDHVLAFDFPTGSFLGVIAELRKLNGQAVLLLK